MGYSQCVAKVVIYNRNDRGGKFTFGTVLLVVNKIKYTVLNYTVVILFLVKST